MTDDEMTTIMGMIRAHQKLSQLDEIAWRSTLIDLDHGETLAALVDAVGRHLRVLPAHVVPTQLQVEAGKWERAEVAWSLVTEGLRAVRHEASAFRRVVAETWNPERPETKALIEMGRELLPSSSRTLEQCRWSFMRAYNRHAGISEVAPPEPEAPTLDAGDDDVAVLVAETQARRQIESGGDLAGLPIVGRRL